MRLGSHRIKGRQTPNHDKVKVRLPDWVLRVVTLVNRYRMHGEFGLVDRTPTPRRQPTATSAEVVARTETMRREHK
nr:leucine zipper domain-containing protein [Amycolatopsis taiwanensis]